MRHSRVCLAFLFACVVAACGGDDDDDDDTAEDAGVDAAAAVLPEPCEDVENQSPANFDDVATATAETCDPEAVEGSGWGVCAQHIHCTQEHSGKGICGDVGDESVCEVHRVYRRSKTDPTTAPPVVDDPEANDGSVGTNCLTDDEGNSVADEYDLLVHATFVSIDKDCAAGENDLLTYCGSATGKDSLDDGSGTDGDGDGVTADAGSAGDGEVSCAEAGVNGTPVRWCIETACVCSEKADIEAVEGEYGTDEATRVQGCENTQ